LDNAQIILKDILHQKRTEEASDLSESEFFEVFVAEQILRRFDPSVDEIESGIVGNGGDGGIDAIYAFVNGELIVDDTDFSGYKRDVHLELYVIQTKISRGFGEDPIHRFSATTRSLLNLGNALDKFSTVYDANLLRIVGQFRKAQRDLATRFPKITISYFYATHGLTQQVHPNVQLKVNDLKSQVGSLFSNATVNFSFLGASELLQYLRNLPAMSLQLQLQENAISTKDGGYLCLVALPEYYNFISEDGQLHNHIFDANVRDYQGNIEVNKEIRKTLMQNTAQDFWWLNNGVTIIATKGTIAGKTLTLEDPQVVNGLQTSLEIYKYFHENPRVLDKRAILVKVIITEDPVSRDEIIKATNSQTAISPASLKATDKIQRDIEDYFLTKGLYYDRRKNFYKNQGKPRSQIVGIQYLAQAITAIVLREPDTARARPTTLLKREGGYERVFNSTYPIQVYSTCVRLMRLVETHLKGSHAEDLTAPEKNSLRYHVAMYVALKSLGRASYDATDISNINAASLTPEFLEMCVQDVLVAFRAVREQTGHQTDRIVKGTELPTEILKAFTLKHQRSTMEKKIGLK
jgi:hypothetical protein